MTTMTTKNATTPTPAQLDELLRQQKELTEKIRLARGTRDFPKSADMPLEDRIGVLLKERPRSLEELARDLREPAGKVSAAIKPLRKHLFNAGTDAAPAWFWIVGDESPTDQLNAAVAALVRYRPMRFQELLAATGARQGRVSGAIVALERDPESRLVNLDTPTRARWFIVPQGIQLAKLKRR